MSSTPDPVDEGGSLYRNLVTRMWRVFAVAILASAGGVVAVSSPAEAYVTPPMWFRNTVVYSDGHVDVWCLDQHYDGETPTIYLLAWGCHSVINPPGNQFGGSKR